MPISDTTTTLLKRRDVHGQIITWNLDCGAPGTNQIADGPTPDEGELIDAVIRSLEDYIKDDTIVDSVAMSADWASITINDFRGMFGSQTLKMMANEDKAGRPFNPYDRETLDECYKNPELFEQPKSGRQTDSTESSEEPRSNPNELKGYIATYNVSPGAPGPHSRGIEVDNLWDLRALVEELKRVKDKGVIVIVMYNCETAIITVDAPGGL